MIKYSVGAEMNRRGGSGSTVHFNLYAGRDHLRNITDPIEILHLSKAEEERLWDILMPQSYGIAKFILEDNVQ